MKPAPFSWVRVRDVGECVEHLAGAEGDVKIIAGGQSLVPMLALRMATPDRLIDINDVGELRQSSTLDGAVHLGALVRHTQLVEDPRLRELLPILGRAARHIGHVGIRNRGTLAGSLAHADPAAELPAVMVLLDARFTCVSARDAREVAAEEFFLGPYTTALESDELLAGVRVPLPVERTGYGFVEFAPREGDFARAGAACSIADENGTGSRRVRLVLFGVASVPVAIPAPDDPPAIPEIVARRLDADGRDGRLSGLAGVAARRAVEQAVSELRT